MNELEKLIALRDSVADAKLLVDAMYSHLVNTHTIDMERVTTLEKGLFESLHSIYYYSNSLKKRSAQTNEVTN